MGCATLIIICVWLVIQITMYVVMEVWKNYIPISTHTYPNLSVCIISVHIPISIFQVHSRMVDKQLNLKPKRSYLPPPVMRVFHKNAPVSLMTLQVL
jgi:hypothetical protein